MLQWVWIRVEYSWMKITCSTLCWSVAGTMALGLWLVRWLGSFRQLVVVSDVATPELNALYSQHMQVGNCSAVASRCPTQHTEPVKQATGLCGVYWALASSL